MSAVRTVALTSALAASLFVPNVARAEDSAQDRYHRAYELEVVDGKVADAARAYLALIDDADAPKSVRGESRFRFAICSVLLGRSDEARRLLRELADDTDSSDALRARAREYQKAISEIGIGSEIDKKLQSLVFDLGRIPPFEGFPLAYRDFEILGDVARPFLVKLLNHSDVTLAKHAMRILCRMGEPNLMSRWTARIGLDHAYPGLDIRNYLNSHADQIPVLEEKLLALDAKTLDRTLLRMAGPITFSTTFAASLQPGPVGKGALFNVLAGQPGPEQWRLLASWMQAPDAEIAGPAATRVLEFAREQIPNGEPTAGLVLLATQRTLGFRAYQVNSFVWTAGLHALAQRADAEEVLEALETVIDASRGWSDLGTFSPVEQGIGNPLADALRERAPETIDARRHADALIALFRVTRANHMARKGNANDGQFSPPKAVFASLRRALARLNSAQLATAVDALFEGLGDEHAALYLGALPLERDALATRALAILNRLRPETRLVSLERLALQDARMRSSSDPAAIYSIGVARVLLQTLPELAQLERAPRIENAFLNALAVVAPPASTEPLVRYARASGAVRHPKFGSLLTGNFSGRSQIASVPAFAAALVEMFEATRKSAVRTAVVEWAIRAVAAEREGLVDLGDSRAAIVSFVRNHCASVKYSWQALADSDDLFPITDWLRYSPAIMWPGLLPGEIGSARMNAAAREIATQSEPPNEAVLAFVVRMTSDDVRDEVVDTMLRNTPSEQLAPVVRGFLAPMVRGRRFRNVNVGSVAAIENALRRLIASENADLSAVSSATSVLALRHPSPSLFPAARWLLAHPDRKAVLKGIELTNSLGRTELIPDLIAKLDSMDSEVRTKAREAIDAILELERLRKEARERFGKSGSERDK